MSRRPPKLEKEIWCHPKGSGGEGKENMANIDHLFQSFLRILIIKKTGKRRKTHRFFPLSMTYISFLFFFSWQVPQITYISKKSFLPPAVFYTAGFTCVVRVGWGPTAQLCWFFPTMLIGISHLSSMWCPDSPIIPDGPVNLNLDYTLESSGEALEGEKNNPHFQAAPGPTASASLVVRFRHRFFKAAQWLQGI